MELSHDGHPMIEGKVALVTGASRGIGRAIAETYAANGAYVLLSSRKQDALDEAATTMPGHEHGRIGTFAAHAGKPDEIELCVRHCIDRFGGIDILVNNAATNPYMGPNLDIDLARYDKTFEVNLRGVLVWIQETVKRSMGDRGGSIINMASIGGLTVEPSIGIYNVTKAALLHLTRTMAAELAPGIRVNAIAPGLVKTDMARALWEPAEEALAAHMPLGRLGLPQDIADAALFLASDLSSWITGQTLVVDGGATISGR